MSRGLSYDQTSDFQQQQFNVLISLASESVALDNISSLLDIGSGTGARTTQCFDLMPNLIKIDAIEPDNEMIEVARTQYADPRISYIQKKAEQLLAEDNNTIYDAIISNWSLHWVSDKNKLMSYLNAKTNPNSIFMFSTCEALPDILQAIDREVRERFNLQNIESPFHYLNANQWQDLLTNHGWKIIAQKPYPITREIEDPKKYLDHWFSASTAKFTYGHQIPYEPLIEIMNQKFKSAKAGIAFQEDALFLICRRLG